MWTFAVLSGVLLIASLYWLTLVINPLRFLADWAVAICIVFPLMPSIAVLTWLIRTRSPDIFWAASAVFKVIVVDGISLNWLDKLFTANLRLSIWFIASVVSDLKLIWYSPSFNLVEYSISLLKSSTEPCNSPLLTERLTSLLSTSSCFLETSSKSFLASSTFSVFIPSLDQVSFGILSNHSFNPPAFLIASWFSNKTFMTLSSFKVESSSNDDKVYNSDFL